MGFDLLFRSRMVLLSVGYVLISGCGVGGSSAAVPTSNTTTTVVTAPPPTTSDPAPTTGSTTPTTGTTTPTTETTVAASLQGAPEIADNFSTDSALMAAGEVPGVEPDPVGAFRFGCAPGQLLYDDPIVYPGQPGKSHLHQFFGNTGANASSTYQSLRTTGGTTCGNTATPVQRSAYWIPAMLDGVGNAVKPVRMLTYYKRLPASNPACGAPDAFPGADGVIHGTHIGYCIGVPNGLRFIFGYNMTTMSGGPADVNSPDYYAFAFECVDANGGALAGRYHTIADVVAENKCPLGTGYLRVAATIPHCWDGKNLDSPDHRSHMAYATEGGVDGIGRSCPKDHPYYIPELAGSFFYKIDAAFLAGKWRLSSDEMHPGLAAGTTMHMDYWEAWSPSVKTKWQNGCIDLHLSCSNGVLGNGQQIRGMGAPDGGWPAQQVVPLSSISK